MAFEVPLQQVSLERATSACADLSCVEAAHWVHVNPATGTRLSIQWAEDAFRASLPCPRPSFFLSEALELISQIGLRAEMDHDTLHTSWLAETRARAQALRAQGRAVPTWTRDGALQYARYMREKPRLLVELDGDGVFAPAIFLFADHRGEPRVRTAVAWCDGQATLFPECDLVMILDRSHEATASGQDTRLRGFASRDEIIDALAPHLDSVETPFGPVPALRAKISTMARAVFRALRTDAPPSSNELVGIRTDHDIEETPLSAARYDCSRLAAR